MAKTRHLLPVSVISALQKHQGNLLPELCEYVALILWPGDILLEQYFVCYFVAAVFHLTSFSIYRQLFHDTNMF